MSSYWAGYHGVALVLTYEDVEGILKNIGLQTKKKQKYLKMKNFL